MGVLRGSLFCWIKALFRFHPVGTDARLCHQRHRQLHGVLHGAHHHVSGCLQGVGLNFQHQFIVHLQQQLGGKPLGLQGGLQLHHRHFDDVGAGALDRSIGGGPQLLQALAAALLATYLWYVIAVDVGSGSNRFDRKAGLVTISRRGFRKPISVEIPMRDVKAVKVEVRDGFNARRRVSLRIQGRRDMPLTRVGEPLPLAQLEQDGAELARFLGVNLEGL